MSNTLQNYTNTENLPKVINNNITPGMPTLYRGSKSNSVIIESSQYVNSYNYATNTADWSAWHMKASDIGNAPRSNDFRENRVLNMGYDQSIYNKSGFDKGHIVTSHARSDSAYNNSQTYLLNNILPQSSDSNSGPWNNIENSSKANVSSGNEEYIVSGGFGSGGFGAKGYKESLNSKGKSINVPSVNWKVILTVRKGGDINNPKDILSTSAYIVPNTIGIRNIRGDKYKTSIASVEKLTGYSFFNNIRNLNKGEAQNAPGLSFNGILNYKDLPVTYIPFLNDLRLIASHKYSSISYKPETTRSFRQDTSDPNKITYISSDKDKQGYVAVLPFNPTSLSDAYYKDFNRETLPQQQIYSNIYRFTTGGDYVPESVKKLDSEINYMGLGHRFNRLTKRNIYNTGDGLLGSIFSSFSRLADSALGQEAVIEQKHILKQDRKGSLKRILSNAQYTSDDDDLKGVVENTVMGAFKTLEAVAIATASYVTINKTFQILTSSFERDFLNSLVQRNETGKMGTFKMLATNAFFGSNFAQAIQEANLESASDLQYKDKLSSKLQKYNSNNTVINADGNLERSSINQPALLGLTSRMRKMDATKVRDLVRPIFEMINPYNYGSHNYNKFIGALDNIVDIAGATPQVSFTKSGDLVSSKPIIKNIGTDRIRKIAKSWDKLGTYLPANIAYWVPNLRESLNLPQFDPSKDLTIKDIVSFDKLTVYTQHYTDKIISFGKNPLQGIKETSSYLKDLSKIYAIENKLNALESSFKFNPFTTDVILNNKINIQERALDIESRKAAGYVKGSNRISSFIQNNAEYFELLKQQNEITRKLNIPGIINPALDYTNVNLKTSEEALRVSKSSKKFIFGLGIALLANKFLDDYLFSSPGASLPTQITAYFGLKVSNDANDPNNKDLTVARFKYTDVIPSQYMWGLAGTVGLISGKLFPDVRDVTFRSGGVYDRLTNNVKNAVKSEYFEYRSSLPNIENAELLSAQKEATKKLSQYNLEAGKLKSTQVRRLSNKFNTKVAGITALGVVIGSKVLFSLTAGLLNFIGNSDEGVTYKDNQAMTIALLNRLTRDNLNKEVTGQNISEVNQAISLSSSLSNFSVTPNRTYAITNQTTTPFAQIALLSQIKATQKLGGKDNEDKGIASFGVSFQLLPISGLGFTLMSPIGIRLKPSSYKNLYSLRSEPKNFIEGTSDFVTGAAYTTVNFLTLGQKAKEFQLGYISGTGFDELLMSSGAVFATSVAFDHMHSFARPGLVRSYGESSRLVKEFDALMQNTKAARAVTYGAYRFSDRAMGFMGALPFNTVKATTKGIYNFFASNPDTSILEENNVNRNSSSSAIIPSKQRYNLLRNGLAYYLPLAVARVLSDPSNGFVGQGFQDSNYQLAATLQVGLFTGALLQGSGIFASNEQLAADFRRAVQIKGTNINQYHGARQSTELNKTIDSIFDASMEYKQGLKGVKRFTPTGILFRLSKNALYEQGVAVQSARNISFEAPKQLPGSRFGGATRFMYSAAIITGLVLASKFITGMFDNDQNLENFYKNNPFAPGIRLLAGVEPRRNNVDETGFDIGVINKERRNGIGNFVSNLSTSLTFGLLDIGKLTGLYSDTANPFFSMGPFGASFKSKQVTGYTQFASSFSDLSTSAFDLAKNTYSIEDLVNTTRLFRNGTPKSLTLMLARIRGATPRQTPMKISGVSRYSMYALSNSQNLSRELYRRQSLAENLSWQRSSELSMDLSRDLNPWIKGAGAFNGNILLSNAYNKYVKSIYNPFQFIGSGDFTVLYPDASNRKDTSTTSEFYLTKPSTFNNVTTGITPLSVLNDFSNFGVIGKALSMTLLGFSGLAFLKGATGIIGSLSLEQASKDALNLYQESRISHLFKSDYKFGVNVDAEPFFYQQAKGSKSVFRLPLDFEEYSNSIGRNSNVVGSDISNPTKLNSLAASISSHHKGLINTLKNYFTLEGSNSFSKSLSTYLDYSLGSDRSDIVNKSNQFKNDIKSNVIKRITTSLDRRKLHVGSNINLFQALYQHSTPEGKVHFQDFMQIRINPLLDEVVEDLTEHLATIQRGGEFNKTALTLHARSFLQKSNSFNLLLNTLSQPLTAELPLNQQPKVNFNNLSRSQQQLVNSIIEKPWTQSAVSTVSKSLSQVGSLTAQWVFTGKLAYELAEASTVLLSGTSDPSLRLAASRQLTTSTVYGLQAYGISKLVNIFGAKGALLNAGISLGALGLTELLKKSSSGIRSFESGLINKIAGGINYITKPLSYVTKYLIDPTLDKLFRTVSAPFISDSIRNRGKDSLHKQILKLAFLPQTSYMAEYEFRMGAVRWGEDYSSYVYGNSNMYIRQQYDAEFQQSQNANNPIDKKLIHANLLAAPAGALDNIYEDSIFKSYDGVSRVSEEFSIGRTYKISNLIQQELKRRQVLYDQLVIGSSVSHAKWNHIHKDTYNTIVNRYSFQYGGGLATEANKFIKFIGNTYERSANFISTKLAEVFPKTASTLSTVLNKENQSAFINSMKERYSKTSFSRGMRWLFDSETYKAGLKSTGNWLTSGMTTESKAALLNILRIEPLKYLDRQATSFGLNVTGSILGFLTSRIKPRSESSVKTSTRLSKVATLTSKIVSALSYPFKALYSGLVNLNKSYELKLQGLESNEVNTLKKPLFEGIKKFFNFGESSILKSLQFIKNSSHVKVASNFLYEKTLTPKHYLSRLNRLGTFSRIANSGFLAFDAYNAFNIDKGIRKVNEGGQFRREYYSNYDAYGASFAVLGSTTIIKGVNYLKPLHLAPKITTINNSALQLKNVRAYSESVKLATTASKYNKVRNFLRNPLLSIGFIITSAIVGGKIGDAYGEYRFKQDYYNKEKPDPYVNQKDWIMAGILGTIFQLPSIINKSFIRQKTGEFKFSFGALGKNLALHTGANVAFSVVGNTAFGYGALTNATILSYYDSFKGFGKGFKKAFSTKRNRSPLPKGYYPEAKNPAVEKPILKQPNIIENTLETNLETQPIKNFGSLEAILEPASTFSQVKNFGSLEAVTSNIQNPVLNTNLSPRQFIQQLIQNTDNPALNFAASKNIPIVFDQDYNFNGMYSLDKGFSFGRNILQTITAKLKGGNVSGNSLAMSLDTIFHEALHVSHINKTSSSITEFHNQITRSLVGKGDSKYQLGLDETVPENVRQGIMARSRASTVAYAKQNLDSGNISYSDFKKVLEYEIQANTYAYKQILSLSKSQPHLNLDLSYYQQPSSTVDNPTINSEFRDIRQYLISEKRTGNNINHLYSVKPLEASKLTTIAEKIEAQRSQGAVFQRISKNLTLGDVSSWNELPQPRSRINYNQDGKSYSDVNSFVVEERKLVNSISQAVSGNLHPKLIVEVTEILDKSNPNRATVITKLNVLLRKLQKDPSYVPNSYEFDKYNLSSDLIPTSSIYPVIEDPWNASKNISSLNPSLNYEPNQINNKSQLLLAAAKNPLPISPKPGQSLYNYGKNYKLVQRFNKLPDNKFTQYFKGKIQNVLLGKLERTYFEAPEINTVRLGKYVTGVTSSLNLAQSGLSSYQYQNVNYRNVDQLTEQAALNTTIESTQQISNIITPNFKFKLIAGAAAQAMVTGKVFGMGNFSMIKDPYGIVSKYQKQQKEQLRLGHAIYDPFGLGNSARVMKDTEVLHKTVNFWAQTKKLTEPMYDILKDNKVVSGLSKRVSNSRFVNILTRLTLPITNRLTSIVNSGMLKGSNFVKRVDKGVSFVGSQFARLSRAAEAIPLVGKVFSILNSNNIKYGLKKTTLDFLAPALDIYTASTSAYSFVNREGGSLKQYEYDYAQTLTATRSLEGSIMGNHSLGVAGDIAGALMFNFQAQSTIQKQIDFRIKAGDLYSKESRTAALTEDVFYNSSSRILAGTYAARAGVAGVSGTYQAYQGYRTLQTLNAFSKLGDSRFAINAVKANPGLLGKVGNAINLAKAGKAATVASNIIKAGQPIIQVTAPLLKTAAVGARFLDPAISIGMIGYGHYKLNSLNETSSKERYESAYKTTYKGYGSLAGGIIGSVLGSFLGPLGTAVGGAVGSLAGGAIGDAVGGALATRAYNKRKTTDTGNISRNIGVGAVIGTLAGIAGTAALIGLGVIGAAVALPALAIGAAVGLLAGAIVGGFWLFNKAKDKIQSKSVSTNQVNSKPASSLIASNKVIVQSNVQLKSIESKGKVDTNRFDLLNFLTGASPAVANELETQALKTQIKRNDINKASVALVSERNPEMVLQDKVNRINKKSNWLSNIGEFFSKGVDWFNKKTNDLNNFFRNKVRAAVNKVKEVTGISPESSIDYSSMSSLPGYSHMPGLQKIVNGSVNTAKPAGAVTGKTESIGNLKRGGNDLTPAQVARLTPLGKYLYQHRNNKYILALGDTIARAEGTDFRSYSKNFGYDMIIGNKNVGLDVINKGHPFVEGGLGYRHNSSASGRVQFMDFNYSLSRAKKMFPGATNTDLGKLIMGNGDNPGSLSPGIQDLGTSGGIYKRLGKARFERLLAGDITNIFGQQAGGYLGDEYASIQKGNSRSAYKGQGTPEGQLSNMIPFLQERIKARDNGSLSNTMEMTGNVIGNVTNSTINNTANTVEGAKNGTLTNLKKLKNLLTGQSNNVVTSDFSPNTGSPSKPQTINAEAIAKQYGLQSLNIVDFQGNAIADYNKKKPPKHPASTIKLVVADVALSIIDPNKVYTVTADSVAIGEDKYFAGTKLTGAQLIRNSLKDSDNTSNNVLISIMGGEEKVTQLAKAKGYSSITVGKLSIPGARKFTNVASNEDVTKALVSISNNNTSIGKIAQSSLSAKDRFQPFNINNEIASKIGNNSKVIGNTSIVDIKGSKYIITAFIDHNKYKQGQADTPQSRKDIKDAQNTVVKLLSNNSSNNSSLSSLSSSPSTSTYMNSMFPGVPLNKLADYKPLYYQGMNATRQRGNSTELHNKIDFDSRVGGGENAPVISMTSGTATWGKFTDEADSGFIRVKTKDDKGRDVEITYGHLSLNSIRKAFNNKNNIQIPQGFPLGNVYLENYARKWGAHVDLEYKIDGKKVDVQSEMKRLVSGGNIPFTSSNSVSNDNDKRALDYYNNVRAGNFDFDAKSLLNGSNSLSILKVGKDNKTSSILSANDPSIKGTLANKTTVNINGETYVINARGKDAQSVLDTTSRSIDMLSGNTAIAISQSANSNGQVTITRQILNSDKIPVKSFANNNSVDVNVLPFKQLIDNATNPGNSNTGEITSSIINDGGDRPTVVPKSTSANTSKKFYTSKGVKAVTSGIGMRTHPLTGKVTYHAGVDLGLPSGAAFKNPFVLGQVVQSGNINPTGYGNTVYIAELNPKTKLPTGRATMVGHLRNNSLTQSAGSIVPGGTVLGIQGSTGGSKGDHFHVEEFRGITQKDIANVASNPSSVFTIFGSKRDAPSAQLLKALGSGSVLSDNGKPNVPTNSSVSSNVNLSKYNRNSYILVTRTGQKTDKGEEILSVQNIQNGKVVSTLSGISGIGNSRKDKGNTQQFRLANQSISGSAEPTPEGTYRIKNAVYSSNPGIKGDFFEYTVTGNTRTSRSALGFHYDADRDTKPGTIGCIGFMSKDDMNTFKQWMNNGASRDLVVDWGLGTFKDNAKPPKSKEAPKPVKSKPQKHSYSPSNESLNVAILHKEQNISKEHLAIIAAEVNKIKNEAKVKLAKYEAEKPIKIPVVNVAKVSKYQPDSLADSSMPPKHRPTYSINVESNSNANKVQIDITEPGIDTLAQWHQIQGGSSPSPHQLMDGNMSNV